MKKQASGRRVMNHRNRTLGEDSDDKNESYSKVNSENVTHSQEGCIIKLPVIASFAGTVKKIPPQEPRYCRSSFHTNNSPILLEKTKAVSKVKDRDYMLEMIPYNLRSDKTEKIGPVIKDSDEFGSADLERNENIPRKEKLTRESCKKRSKEISKLKQQDLHVELERVLRNGSKQPSVRSAREQLEEVPVECKEIKTDSQASQEVLPSFHQASLTPVQKDSRAAENESQPTDELLTYNKQASSTDVLWVEGKAISKIKPDEIQKDLREERNLQQCLSFLPTQASNVKHQNNRSIHHLCTAFPGFMLPPYLQMASRIYHTSDRRGHNILFTAEDIDNRQKESIYSEYIYLKELAEWKRICFEGVPASELFQNNQKDGIHFLPRHTSVALAECQKADYSLNKAQLQLVGEKVSLYPEALKMFWAPIPPKFFAPISSMKDILFPKYESNVIEDITYEDFLISDEEELETQRADLDFCDLLEESVLRRCQSFSHFSDSENSKEINLIKRSASAPEITAFKHETTLKMPANFKTSMAELEFMKQQIAKPKVEIKTAKRSPAKHPLNQICDDCHSKKTNAPVEKMPTLTGQEDSENAEVAKRAEKAENKNEKKKKSKKAINPRKLEAVIKKLNQPSRILKRSVSLGRLLIHNKFIIKVSPAIKLYQSPSIPCLLDFEKFAEVRGGIPKETSARAWVSGIWRCWLDETFPDRTVPEKETELLKGAKAVGSQVTNLQIELVDSMQPVLLEGAAYTTEDLEEEVRRLTDLIEKVERPSAFQYCRRGAIRRKLGKLKSAMDDLEKAISLEPQLLDAYWHRHLIYLFQDNFSAALDDLNFITESNKNKVDAYLSKAEIYRKLGDNTMAINNYSSAIQCNSTDDDIYFRRAELYFEEDELLLAVDDYAKCFQYNPKRTDALMKHGIYFFDHSILTTAIRDFTAVIREDPSNAQARLYRGRAYTKQKRYKNAIHDLAAAIRLDPSCWLAFYNRGYILREIDPKRALQDFSVSVLINDTQENFSSFLYRGVIYSNQQQWLLAICDFESLIALDSCIIFAYLNIGLILLLHLDQYYEAIRQFTNAIKIDPLNVQAYLCRAQAYHKIHNLSNAVKDINRAIHLYPDKTDLLKLRGQYLMEMKKYELASLCIHQIAKMNEVSLEFQPVQQALIQSFCQNHSEAIECLRKAATTQPEPSMFVLLGKIQMKAAKTEDAVESFKKAINLLMTSDKTLPHTFEAAEMHYLLGLCYMEQVNLSEACDAFSKAVRLHSRYPDAFYQRGLCQMQLSETKCIQDFNHTLLLCPSHFQAYMGRAAYYESEGRYSKAIMNCNEAIKIHPDNVHAYFYRGILKYQNKTFIAAIEDFSKTIDLDNTCILAYYNRAICYHQIKNFRKALKDYGIFLLHEMSKEIVLKVFINRGLLYLELGDDATACEDFKEAALLSPGDSQIFQAIGTCHSRLNEFEEAARSLTQVLKLEPISVEAYIGRGNSYMKNGQAGLEQAQKDFLKAIHLNPMCTEARICLGYILQALGKLQSAWKQLTAVIAIDSKCDTAYEGRASVSLQMGGIFSAFQDVNAALKLTTTAQLLTNRGIINQLMGYLSCAMKDYQQAISVDPNCALAYFSAANIYFNNHQFSQAYCYYSEVLKLEPRNESAIMNRAVTNTILKNFEEAKEDFEKAICLCPFSAAVYFNRANFYNALNQYELAERDISTALSIQPNDAMMYRLRADIRAKLGFSREALEDYKRAVSIKEETDYTQKDIGFTYPFLTL
ncbi:tetratricopeptide repeat protein 6 isoform X2 [Coturnix japonica]|uniref:Tetratricopeptide repeat domain 6 n=1 Tax=Coturnix japonica TaxID=93934 RepID=A0A8C2YG64_COTJA|nr:tetratricopeptide repeat protein 6 isoform X2 [Coturnix japonica]